METKDKETSKTETGSESAVERLVMPEEVEILLKQDNDTLARWWCQLNSWEWPERLPNAQPPPERLGGEGYKAWRGGLIMDFIQQQIGHMAISREWNRKRMTDSEHRDFYNGNHLGDKEALQRDIARRKLLFSGGVREA